MFQRALSSYQTLQVETAVSAASPGELIVLVYDRILGHVRDARNLMANGENVEVPIRKALDLINEGLVAALDAEKGGDIAANLAALYDWATRTLLRARLRRDVALLDDVIRVFSPLRDAWAASNEQEPVAV